MADIFISYARADRDWVRPFAEALNARGFSVWFDTRLSPGQSFEAEIARELAGARAVVAVWSRASIESDWVKDEAGEGRRRGILVPVLKERIEPPLGFRQSHAADLSRWKAGKDDALFDGLVDALAALCGAPQQPPVKDLPPRRRLTGVAAALGLTAAVLGGFVFAWTQIGGASGGDAMLPPETEAQRVAGCMAQFDAAFPLKAALRSGGRLIPPIAAPATRPTTQAGFELVAPPRTKTVQVSFDDEAHLSSPDPDDIGALLAELAATGDKTVCLFGMTDTYEAPVDTVSLARAGAVRDALVARGIEARRIVTAAGGTRKPIVKTGPNMKEPVNRYVIALVMLVD